MPDITPETITARFDANAGQWAAHFERTPQIAFDGDLPVCSHSQATGWDGVGARHVPAGL